VCVGDIEIDISHMNRVMNDNERNPMDKNSEKPLKFGYLQIVHHNHNTHPTHSVSTHTHTHTSTYYIPLTFNILTKHILHICIQHMQGSTPTGDMLKMLYILSVLYRRPYDSYESSEIHNHNSVINDTLLHSEWYEIFLLICQWIPLNVKTDIFYLLKILVSILLLLDSNIHSKKLHNTINFIEPLISTLIDKHTIRMEIYREICVDIIQQLIDVSYNHPDSRVIEECMRVLINLSKSSQSQLIHDTHTHTEGTNSQVITKEFFKSNIKNSIETSLEIYKILFEFLLILLHDGRNYDHPPVKSSINKKSKFLFLNSQFSQIHDMCKDTLENSSHQSLKLYSVCCMGVIQSIWIQSQNMGIQNDGINKELFSFKNITDTFIEYWNCALKQQISSTSSYSSSYLLIPLCIHTHTFMKFLYTQSICTHIHTGTDQSISYSFLYTLSILLKSLSECMISHNKQMIDSKSQQYIFVTVFQWILYFHNYCHQYQKKADHDKIHINSHHSEIIQSIHSTILHTIQQLVIVNTNSHTTSIHRLYGIQFLAVYLGCNPLLYMDTNLSDSDINANNNSTSNAHTDSIFNITESCKNLDHQNLYEVSRNPPIFQSAL